MAEKKKGKIERFTHLVSPLGQDPEETPAYSPSRPVTGAFQPPAGKGNASESRKNERRGG